jgi:hypothetical protein
MAAAAPVHTFDLADGEILQLADARGTTIHARLGTLWLTQHRDVRDIVLEPGESFRIDASGLTLVQAHRAARVSVANDVSAGGSSLGDRLLAWLGSFGLARMDPRSVPHV